MRPGPQAQVVGRPRVVAVAGWCTLLAIGLFAIAIHDTGPVIVGCCFGAVGLLGLVAALRTRVWVDGDLLHSRTLRGYAPPIRLDRLTRADLSAFGRNDGRQLHLADADGTCVTLDATNARLARLYAVLAERIRHDDPVANKLLQRRMAKHRPRSPLGLT